MMKLAYLLLIGQMASIWANWSTDVERSAGIETRGEHSSGQVVRLSESSTVGDASRTRDYASPLTKGEPEQMSSPVTKASAKFEDPSTPEELNKFVNKYAGRFIKGPLFPTVDSIYEAEARDERWALPMEKIALQIAESMSGASTKEGDCRTSLCRFRIQFVPLEHPDPLEFGSKLLQLQPEATNGVNVIFGGLINGMRTYYIFSLRSPATYVRPMQEKLGVCAPTSCWEQVPSRAR